MTLTAKNIFYPYSKETLKIPQIKALLDTGKVEVSDDGVKSVSFIYQCDKDGGVLMDTLAPSGKTSHDTIPGLLIEKDESTLTAEGMMYVHSSLGASIVLVTMQSDIDVDLVTDELFTLKRAYYKASPSLKKHFDTFMSVDAILCLNTNTVIDFTQVDKDYGNLQSSDSAVISQTEDTITFKAYVANGGFNVSGAR
ncbi:MAG: hypothetical protein CBC55_02565 [Gammaproteobacteria bacterium TMED95]|nr:MAG: hypothetical protein CBC55_02565 [Gammaproteobacteria bacterium TMED95]|tara:strand:+ start:3343 stop:3930 length:588 start_codon:yes stop_codon:yes gene_type:complete